jgi:hypothetical protein
MRKTGLSLLATLAVLLASASYAVSALYQPRSDYPTPPVASYSSRARFGRQQTMCRARPIATG